jgi:hypothetical protein
MTRSVSVVGGAQVLKDKNEEQPPVLSFECTDAPAQPYAMRDRVSSSLHRHDNFNITKMSVRVQKAAGVDHVLMSSTRNLSQRKYIIDSSKTVTIATVASVGWHSHLTSWGQHEYGLPCEIV